MSKVRRAARHSEPSRAPLGAPGIPNSGSESRPRAVQRASTQWLDLGCSSRGRKNERLARMHYLDRAFEGDFAAVQGLATKSVAGQPRHGREGERPGLNCLSASGLQHLRYRHRPGLKASGIQMRGHGSLRLYRCLAGMASGSPAGVLSPANASPALFLRHAA